MKQYLTSAIAFGTSLVISYSASAKGLNQLDPKTEEKPSSANTESSESTSQDNPTASPPKGEQADPGLNSGTSSTPGTSDSPTWLSDKLVLGAGYGWGTIKSSTGTWSSSGVSDFSVAYKLTSINKIDLFGTYRYAPFAASVSIDEHAYVGIQQWHDIGAKGTIALKEKIRAFGSAELGYSVSKFSPSDGQSGKNPFTSGAGLILGGGVDLYLQDKFSTGPKMLIGLGKYRTFQLSLNCGFGF